MVFSRRPTALSIPLLALPLSCTGGGSDDDIGDDETGDGDGDGPCTDPGTPVDGFDPFTAPASAPAPICSAGWASDAPRRDPKWVTMIPAPESYYYYSSPPIVKALANDTAVLIDEQRLQWFDGEGAPAAEVEHGFPMGWPGLQPSAVVVRAADDHLFIAGPDDSGDDLVIREFADGAVVGEIAVPTPGESPRAVGLFEFSTDDWLIVGDEFDPMEYSEEAFFMHVDAAGAEVLRKARPLGYSYYYSQMLSVAALDADDNLMFGSTTLQWLVDPSSGAVINPSVGLTGVRDVVGSAAGAGFVSATLQINNSSDGAVSRINGFGANQWTQVYDRALTPDSLFDVDARSDGGFVAAGLDGIWWDSMQFQQNSQPLIIAFDGDGNAEWIGRLAIPGLTRNVDVATDGGIAASGTARLGGSDFDQTDSFIWLAVW